MFIKNVEMQEITKKYFAITMDEKKRKKRKGRPKGFFYCK